MSDPNTPEQPRGEQAWSAPGWTPPSVGYTSAPGSNPGYAQEPRYAQAPPGAPVAPSWAPAPQPGVIPLRPLALADLFEGTFRAVRSNPTVMFGFSVVVMAVVSLVSAFIQWLTMGSFLDSLTDPQGAAQAGDDLTAVASQISGVITGTAGSSLLTSLATILITGILALSVADAVLGQVTDLGNAWARVKPRLLPLLGYTVLSGLVITVSVSLLVGVAAVPLMITLSNGGHVGVGSVLPLVVGALAALCLLIVLGTRFLFGASALVLERIGPLRALGRTWRLTGPSFWRVLGRAILITLVTSAAAGVIGGAVSIVGAVVAALGSEAVGSALTTFLAGTVSGLVLPITAAFETLMYLDERMRQENFAQTLRDAAHA